jgi:hypothetical protein
MGPSRSGAYQGKGAVFHMNTALTVLIVVVLIAAAVIAFALFRINESRRLRARFGPEYRRAVEETGSTLRAEQRLASREKRVERFQIHPLSAAARTEYIESWRVIQAKFVDDPHHAVGDADRLIRDVMNRRGYPVADFERQAADLSVHHPLVVEHYRAAHDIAVRHSRDQATTEDLRQAMIHYRKLFADLVEEPQLAHSQGVGDADAVSSQVDGGSYRDASYREK